MAALGNANITLNDKSYPALADGKYDVVICGTGLTECIVSGLLCQKGMRVLQVDRNRFYGSACASLTLTNLFKSLKEGATRQVDLLGKDRYYNVDLVPKLIMVVVRWLKLFCIPRQNIIYTNEVDGSLPVQGENQRKFLPALQKP